MIMTGCSAPGPGGSPAAAETPVPSAPAEAQAPGPPESPAPEIPVGSPSSTTATGASATMPSADSSADSGADSSADTSPAPSPSPTPSPAPPGSFVLGDSIGLSVAPTLSRLGYPVTGKVGQTASTEFLSTHLASDAAQQAPAWVIVLGTNNRGDETDLARLDEWLRTIRTSRSRPRQHVYWVTPHRPPEYDGGMSTHTLDAFNAALKQADAERPWLTVLDFATLAAQNPDWYALDGARLHPDERGQAALIELIAGPGAPAADSPAPITEIARPTPSPTAAPTGDDAAEFGDMEFTNE